MNTFAKLCAAAVAALILSACSTPATDRTMARIEQDAATSQAAFAQPVVSEPRSRVTVIRSAVVPVTAVAAQTSNEWLRKIRVNVDFSRPTSMSAVIASLAAQGVNISAPFPLESYSFSGRLTNANGETALQAILGAVGLDYSADDSRQLVTLRTMSSRTWYMNLGNRRSGFTTESGASSLTPNGSGTQATSNSGQTSGSQGSNGQTGSSSTQPTAGQQGQSAGGQTDGSASGLLSSSGSGGNTVGVTSGDDFWGSIARELQVRLQVMIPAPRQQAQQQPQLPQQPGVPGMTMQVQAGQPGMMYQPNAGQGQGADLFVKKTVGTYALNPETGAITVQAPSWILQDLDAYFEQAQEMYNSSITFSGQLVRVTSSVQDNEGLDISAFTKFASNYGLLVSNNGLGGVTVSVPSSGVGLPSISVPNATSPLLGLQYQGARTALQVFNAFLSTHGRVSVMQRPTVTTTSGVPGTISYEDIGYYNTITQSAASGGTGSAAVATNNNLVQYSTGLELELNPRLDVSRGLVRAQFKMLQAIKNGEQPTTQTVTFGNTSRDVTSMVPKISRQRSRGEIVLKEGDLVIVGGQTETVSQTNASGLPGSNGPLVGLLGNRETSQTVSTTYFALSVEVTKRK